MSVKDESRVEEVLAAIEKLQTGRVHIGILGDSDSEILMVASVQEFGVNIDVTDKMRNYLHAQGLHLKKTTKQIKIPERSFVRSSFDENKNKIANTVNEMLVEVVELKRSPDEVFDVVGEYCVGLIQDYMTEIKKPALHPFTIEQKGSSNPLINTGRLRDAIDYEIKYS